MRFESPLLHSLPNLKRLKALYRKPDKTRPEELFLATEMTSQGFPEAGGYIDSLRATCVNRSQDVYLAKLSDQWAKIQQFDNLRSNLQDINLINSMYRRDCAFIEKGAIHPEKLLIVFTTMFNNFYLSNLVLLTFLRRFGVTILLLKDDSVFNYINGVKGFGNNLLEVSTSMKMLATQRGIKEIFITGFSSSGYASLLFSTFIQCDGYLGFSIRSDLSPNASASSGKYFSPQVREKISENWLLDLADVISSTRNTDRRKIVYGSLSRVDADHALHLRGLGNLKVEMIEGCGHLTVAEMLVKETLASEFRSLLFDVQ